MTAKVECMWVALPYHPVWHESLSKAFHGFIADGCMCNVLQEGFMGKKPPNIRLSWKNALKNLDQRVKSIQEKRRFESR